MDKKDNEGIVFSDSDDENAETDAVRSEVVFRLQENIECSFRAFKDFLCTPSFINNKGDPTTNIIDRYSKKCYNIPVRKMSKFFKFLEICRRKKLKMMMYEKQGEFSGIMLDFDIKQDHGKSQIEHTHYHRLCIGVFKILIKYLDFQSGGGSTEDDKRHYHIAFTKKPRVLFDTEGDYYKDGLHMLIPGIQISREFKKFLIEQMIEDGLMDKVFKDVVPHSSIVRSDFMDVNSAHVGVHFIGSATKVNSPAYDLSAVYKVQMTIDEPDDIIPVKMNNFDDNTVNICHEFSLNWAKPDGKNAIIEKRRYDIKSQFNAVLDQYKGTAEKHEEDLCEDDEKFYNDLSILNVHDPDMEYIKSMLDILHPKRAEDYDLWFDVLCSLAHTSASYKPLGEYFSRKSPKQFNSAAYESTWDSILANKSNTLSIGSLHYWAKQDNPDRYEEVRHRSIFNLLYKKIYDPQIEGCLEHYDIAEIIFRILKNKYVYDRDENDGTWYEFVLDNEPCKTGELYKWRRYKSRPNSIMRYVSSILPNLFRKVLDRIKSTLDESSTDLSKYHYQIYKNFQRTCRNLKNSGFKRGVSIEAEQLFEQMGFYDKLDNDPNLKGVANGLLYLGKKCKLITGFHGHLVSKFTTAKFKRMNPHEPITKKVLMALHDLFPDDEPDVFNYIMHYLSSTLDGHKKESIMMFLVGKGSNGKSFLVELHKSAIGSTYGVKMPISFLTSRAKDAESATPALMQLKDAHFAYYSESNRCEILNVAKIKEFTGQETLSGRALHQDYINFKPKCHHLVASNNDFEIPGTDHGTWRRIDYIPMKIKFCSLSTDTYDKTNPYERVADPTMGTNWTEDEEVIATYLGILVYYYESLLTNYSSKVRNVPHPTVIRETEEFRNRQDTVNNFLNANMVKCEDTAFEMPMNTVRDRYVKWYDSRYAPNKDARGVLGQLENSKLQKYLKKTKRGNFLLGYRVLDMGESLEEGEQFYIDVFERSTKKDITLASETAEEYHDRLCREYDSGVREEPPSNPLAPEKSVWDNGNNSDSGSDIEDLVENIKKREPHKAIRKLNNIIINQSENTPVDHNGIRVAPKKKSTITGSSIQLRKEYAMMGREDSDESFNEEEPDVDEPDVDEPDVDEPDVDEPDVDEPDSD
jgi:P4 family phage/plasmid primase-like protien